MYIYCLSVCLEFQYWCVLQHNKGVLNSLSEKKDSIYCWRDRLAAFVRSLRFHPNTYIHLLSVCLEFHYGCVSEQNKPVPNSFSEIKIVFLMFQYMKKECSSTSIIIMDNWSWYKFSFHVSVFWSFMALALFHLPRFNTRFSWPATFFSCGN